jgi:hypothetical protein
MRLFYEIIIVIIDFCDEITKLKFKRVSRMFITHVNRIVQCHNSDDLNRFISYNDDKLILKYIKKYQSNNLEIEKLNERNTLKVIKKRFNCLLVDLRFTLMHHMFSFHNSDFTKYILEKNNDHMRNYIKFSYDTIFNDIDLFIEYNNRNNTSHIYLFEYDSGLDDIVLEKQNKFNYEEIIYIYDNYPQDIFNKYYYKCSVSPVETLKLFRFIH